MSLLYKDNPKLSLATKIYTDGRIEFEFTSDCGKHEMEEGIDGYILTPERLLQILQDRDDYTDKEL